MTFTGFSFPDGAWLPPELINRLPYISGSQLKAVIAILYHNLQVGGGEPLSLSDVEIYTGLSHQAVITALRELLEYGMIEREAVGMSYVYRPVVKFLDSGVQKLDSYKNLTPKLRESDREIDINHSLSDSLNLTSDETSLKIRLVQKLRSAGVYLKTAQGIVEAHPAEVIEQHLKYYEHALKINLAQGPGWLVMSLKEGWPAPLGYEVKDVFEICQECFTWPCRCEELGIGNQVIR